ncbi:unnamed protein product [Caenorhabditis bovis]|uniref:Uncharacterized protein n=1 Tax=Caenorhabditis bovis TaxID=2654633 RepID=A0A8S1F969_9PELO|nr:unnamed protein product [Caenorhabditis bovis]
MIEEIAQILNNIDATLRDAERRFAGIDVAPITTMVMSLNRRLEAAAENMRAFEADPNNEFKFEELMQLQTEISQDFITEIDVIQRKIRRAKQNAILHDENAVTKKRT